MKEISPRWVQDLEARKPPPVDAAHVQARDKYLRFYCGSKPYDWWYAETSHIKEGIDYLSKVSGKPRSAPGPGKCTRVSCSYLAAIWWCNDVGLPPLPPIHFVLSCFLSLLLLLGLTY